MPGAQLTYNSNFLNERSIQLFGGAYFDVSSDPDHPFNVSADDVLVTVLGTEFMIDTDERHVRVVVNEGTVNVLSQQKATNQILKEGQAVFVDKINGDVEAIEDPANLLSWKTGILEFDNDPLSKVIVDLSDHYGVQLRFKNSSLASCHLTSVFEDKSLDEVIEILELVLNVEIRKSDQNEYLISGKGC